MIFAEFILSSSSFYWFQANFQAIFVKFTISSKLNQLFFKIDFKLEFSEFEVADLDNSDAAH